MQVQAADIHVAAATNLRFVLPEVAAQFKQQTGHHVAISFAASGTLTTQILHGAPFEVFLSASPGYIERLVQAGKTENGVVDYAKAQLAFYAANHSTLKVEGGMQALKDALSNDSLHKVVIANPKHAPYGQAAKIALQDAGIWNAILPHLLIAENASQALQFTMSTVVDAGFVPYAHVIQPKIASEGRFFKLDETLQQQAVLIKGAAEPAKQFLDFLQTDRAGNIFTKHGFLVATKEH